ncbi:PIN domain-containing protein [Sphaerisporangium sp. NBC_01403]|uniref:PIN domain-containing protein n=1 Tax=Sphaerisporangium sp. NBC_01403 TaxID=2903599 RepID=UPI00324833D0
MSRRPIRDALHDAYQAAHNLYLSHQPSVDLYNAYFEWANDTVRKLQTLISGADIDRLILTPRHWALYSVPVASAAPVRDLVKLELERQATAMQDAYKALDFLATRWADLGVFVVVDTSVYCHHPQRLDEADLAADLGIGEEPLHIVIPMVVIDELDRLKDRGNGDAKVNARKTLKVLDQVLSDPGDIGRIREAGPSVLDPGIKRGVITVELLPDPPSHIRLPRSDDEIVDQALALEGLADRRVRVVTYDTGQSTRARLAGLEAVKLLGK